MAHFIANDQPTNLQLVRVGAQTEVRLWGEGPSGQRLDVAASDPSIVKVEEIPASIGLNLRGFKLTGLGRGSAKLFARLGAGGPSWAETRIIVGEKGLNRYYHGTSSAVADALIGTDLTPMLLSILLAGQVTQFDWTDYTDFGKGFYVHLESNQKMAYEWAKRRFNKDWSVVEFIATEDELKIWPRPPYSSRTSRHGRTMGRGPLRPPQKLWV